MKVPYSWLKEYVDIDISAEELEEKLFGECFETHDQVEGMTAFMEKRKEKNFTNN